ncbi:Uncharacterised protein [Enterobacter hormaechei]|uniref:Uncharacterized protein n=1 Tax=Raoultella ornithinolytica TaxID=54291 RepID=A0A7G9A7V4_RAOOR|nr:Hypothetical protein [Raoultella ornithinolytica]SAH80685.1 Uncharacterised protein [Enterobacter hormaechei]SVL75148.1 Uncharacterised protein [Klebsiella pneumoniae]SWM06539.1 Uncharacterised protein [Klebsiella pneumoniae]
MLILKLVYFLELSGPDQEQKISLICWHGPISKNSLFPEC